MKARFLIVSVVGLIFIAGFVVNFENKPLPGSSMPLTICDTVFDTIYLPNPEMLPSGCQKSTVEMMTAGEWELNELLRRDENGNSFYKRGSTNSTGIEYDKLRLLFRTDGSGIYTDNLGGKHEMTWTFTDAEKKTALLSVDGPYGDKFYWHNIEVTETYLVSTCPYKSDLLLSTRYQRVKR